MLAFMALPTIVSIADDSLEALDKSYKEASLALGANQVETKIGELPVIIRTVSVSPIILPNPNIIPANIPGKAAGRRTLKIVSTWLAPRAREASL